MNQSATAVEAADRGEFKDRKPPKSPGQKAALLVIAIFGVLLLIYGATKTAGIFTRQKPVARTEELKRPENTPNFNITLAEPPKEQAYIECPGGVRLPLGMTCPPDRPPPVARPAQPTGPNEEEMLQKRRWGSDVSVAGRAGEDAEGGASGGLGGRTAAATNLNLNGPTGLGGQLLSTATAKTIARVNRNPSYTLAKGTLPDCTLITAISSDQPGFLKCILSRPVYSMDGKVVLMEAGTTLEGEYQGSVARGKKRMFAVWVRAVTPNFVEVTLNSPTTDALGRSGADGQIDNHWMERFGGALLYSLFSDYTNYLVNRAQWRSQERQAEAGAGAGGAVNIGSYETSGVNNTTRTRATADRIVEAMLTQGEDIQPTLYKNQGEIIKIYVARDVDFSQVYELSRNPKE